jgi:ubiquitin carboxyl-terminal hydrolase 48
MNISFRRVVYEWKPVESTLESDPLIRMQMKALQKLFAFMQFGAKFYYDPQEFASTLSLNQVLQQDAQEFSKLLLSHLRKIFVQGGQQQQLHHLSTTKGSKTFPQYHHYHWNPVDQIFQGEMTYVTKCLKCKTKSTRVSSYYELVSRLYYTCD